MITFLKTILYVPFYNAMIFLAFLAHGSIGWAIIFLTILIRILLLPPSLKASRATLKMQAMQPKLNEIKQKYKGDTKKQNEETMKLYKESGSSPLGCCGPMVIQLVVIIILYRVFFIAFNTANYNLLYSFTPRPGSINTIFFGLNLAKPELWVLPIVAGVTQMILSWMTMPKTDPSKKNTADPMAMMNKQMIFLFPIMTIFIARSLASGLIIYWIVTTIFSIGQQYYVNKTIKKPTHKGTVDEQNSKSQTLNPKQIQNSKSQISNNNEKKPDLMGRVMKGRLDKADKKKGVEVTIREKS